MCVQVDLPVCWLDVDSTSLFDMVLLNNFSHESMFCVLRSQLTIISYARFFLILYWTFTFILNLIYLQQSPGFMDQCLKIWISHIRI